MTESWKEQNWSEYYQLMCGQPPHSTLLKALALFEADGIQKTKYRAVDLGCGSGNDSLELLRLGWEVVAMDREAEALGWLKAGIAPEQNKRLETIQVDFEDIQIPKVDLVNAGYSLPFCPPKIFSDLWNKICNSLEQGGRFSGHFFGIHDGYAEIPEISIQTQDAIADLFKNYDVEYLDERDQLGATIGGIQKHWHIFSLVAKKNR
ncbi:MAG: class I SAM-dependent methyltransferase [Chloroflexi bacterium]|jgi:tellurite methyltransferase|nr:class I SAM-dependent methyltransferase [Chloroflexota bacterium]MBT3668870.1 class I SAM-dependent methyltransferase [Chloroflexota bacterium]MBT4004219.1 class I SAM-dependent methyltransferase [Chloroflexota bacterium]MBT4306584.1 class I SAM-dependent methyltransferase [Chloroflexota bacterium]MBT4533968.1 class I SAM-dependent methyltransferase [Chloroflexota bacterium]